MVPRKYLSAVPAVSEGHESTFMIEFNEVNRDSEVKTRRGVDAQNSVMYRTSCSSWGCSVLRVLSGELQDFTSDRS